MNNLNRKKLILLLLVLTTCLILAYLNLYLKLHVTPTWYNGILERNHKLLLDFNYTNNEQSRLLQFLIPEFFIRIFKVDIIKAYILQRALFTTLSFFIFFFFCKKWFTNTQSFICIVLFALIMPFTYKNHLQESASLMSLTFLCSLWLIRDNKDIIFMIILLVGSINNETNLFLPAVYFFYNYKSKDSIIKFGTKTVLLALPAIVSVGIIRYINIDRPHGGAAWHFIENMHNLDKLFCVYHIFWILPFIFFSKQSFFLKRSLLTIPLFIIPHLITGVIGETRQMLPLGFIIIPASMFTLLEFKTMLNNKYRSLRG